MRWMLVGGVGILALGCAGEDIGLGDGSIDVRNTDDAPVVVLLSDSPECVVGMTSTIPADTVRQFDVGESTYVCVGKEPPGVLVKDGGTYQIAGGSLAAE
jgi:hypothetical protein